MQTEEQTVEQGGALDTSIEIASLATALAKAQAEMSAAAKDSLNPHFKSRYADLAAVWEAIRGPLTKHGLSVVQLPSASGQRVTVETLLLHSSGQWIRSSLSARAMREDAQSIGSAITYLRRYSLQSMAGIAADEDDDGNAASGRDQKPQVTRHRNEEKAKPTVDVHVIYDEKDKNHKNYLWKICQHHGYTAEVAGKLSKIATEEGVKMAELPDWVEKVKTREDGNVE